jgi:hypothetical protein
MVWHFSLQSVGNRQDSQFKDPRSQEHVNFIFFEICEQSTIELFLKIGEHIINDRNYQ